MDYTRQPCPIRIVEDCGCAYLMGSIGGGLFQLIKGIRNSPSGFMNRFYGGIYTMKMGTPPIASNFAIWGLTFTACECAIFSYRKRDDFWNSALSGAAAGGIMAARRGIPAMIHGAFMGFMVLSLFDGAGMVVGRIYADDGEATATKTIDVQTQPQRPQWEPIDSNPKSIPEKSVSLTGHDSTMEGFQRVLEKCRKYQQDAMAGERRRELLDLIKLAEII
ncbi:probable mitochondrial import inner membrane translocase subunit Tim17 4 [Drosophila serrata]|uniref:probable mitochondrial import inner membrane translocase subunit Tim17 4 n=1 Tax=Drosophila serrata TaxID=7274 RepID=UPI000A1D13F2|nr:probable mitochondrial import inner membrane translocase subunit Tim17 4 [Drosophila serrata]